MVVTLSKQNLSSMLNLIITKPTRWKNIRTKLRFLTEAYTIGGPPNIDFSEKCRRKLGYYQKLKSNCVRNFNQLKNKTLRSEKHCSIDKSL